MSFEPFLRHLNQVRRDLVRKIRNHLNYIYKKVNVGQKECNGESPMESAQSLMRLILNLFDRRMGTAIDVVD